MFAFGNRYIWATVAAVGGALQAWDSGVLASTPAVQIAVVLAIALPAAGLLLRASSGWLLSSVAAAFALLTVARLIAPGPLPTLHLIAFIPTLIVLFVRTDRVANSSAGVSG